MITTKQRAVLRAMANQLEPIFQIGKNEIGPEMITEIYNALEARELIKITVLKNSGLTAREACQELSELTRSEQVQVIGTKFVLYRPSHKKDKKDKIVLPKAAKKTV